MKKEPIDVIIKPLSRFIKAEATAGILLFLCALLAVIWANSPYSNHYHELWHNEFSMTFAGSTIKQTLHHWINDGLMAMFFFVVGLELKREIMGGELSSMRNAILPLTAAIGGMIFPAVIFLLFNSQSPERDGWGIPMATDIAFALGILSLLGNRIPVSIKIFLTVLAIADDLGAVLVIAFFYTSNISFISLSTGAAFVIVLITANYLGVRNTLFYGIVGIAGLWLAFLMSGVHATIAGVLAAITIPARSKIDEAEFTQRLKSYTEEFKRIRPNDMTLLEPGQMHVIEKIKSLALAADTPLQRLERSMHPFVAFVILPLFALANAGITFEGDLINYMIHPLSLGISFGLLAGKFIGVVGTCFLMVRLRMASLPNDARWRHIIGVGFLAGIGFTMSLFITNLAFKSDELSNLSKISIMMISVLAGIIGYSVLRAGKKSPDKET